MSLYTLDTSKDGVKEAEHLIAIIAAYYQLGDAKISLTGGPPAALGEQAIKVVLPGMPAVPGLNPQLAAYAAGALAHEASAQEVFGTGNVSAPTLPVPGATPIPAPLAAGAIPLPSAPVVLPVSSTPIATTMGAAPIAALVPAPMASATPTPTPGTAPAQGVEIDVDGLPWDHRIHAATKTKTVKGAWKAKKGINDDALVNRVKAELLAARGVVAAPAPVAAAPVPTPAPAAVPFVPPVASSPPAQPAVPLVSAVPSNHLELMPRLTAAMSAGALPPPSIQAACAAYGLPNAVALQAHPEYCPAVWEWLRGSYPTFAAWTDANP